MTFKEWLPITPRNRVALVFAVFSLVVFVIWNFIPVTDSWGYFGERMFGKGFWPVVFSFKTYLDVIKSTELEDFLEFTAIFSSVSSSLVTLLIIPFWRVFHAAPFLKAPLAILTLMGSLLLLFSVLLTGARFSDSFATALILMAVNMMLTSAALFIFENELAWKSRRLDPRVPRSKPE